MPLRDLDRLDANRSQPKYRSARISCGDKAYAFAPRVPTPPPWAFVLLGRERGDADMLSRLGKLVFIVLPVVVFALGVAVAAIIVLGWVMQHVIA